MAWLQILVNLVSLVHVYSFIAPILIILGACPSFGILYEHCGTFKKRWELTGPEYLIQFHTDSSVQKTGFQMEVSLGNVTSDGSPVA